MGKIVPDEIEAYIASLNRFADPPLRDIAAQGEAAHLPIVDAEVGALLHVLALTSRARHVLEIGTAIGYSGTWMAKALPADGRLLTFEISSERAATARENFTRAGVADRVSVMVGDAARLAWKVEGPFDLIFQDGDKKQYEPLLDRLHALLRPGGLLVTDNVLWDGEVVPGFAASPVKKRADTEAIARYNERLANDTRFRTSWLPLRDGVAVAVKLK